MLGPTLTDPVRPRLVIYYRQGQRATEDIRTAADFARFKDYVTGQWLTLCAPAALTVSDYIKGIVDLSREEGLFALFDVPHDFGNAWYKAMNPPSGATDRIIVLDNLSDRLPFFTRGTANEKIQASDVYLFTPATIPAEKWVLSQSANELTFIAPDAAGPMKSFVIHNNLPMTTWQLKINDMTSVLDKLWIVIRYALK